MEKEKIRYGKVIGKSILIAILASSIILFILFFIDIFIVSFIPCNYYNYSLFTEEAQIQNRKFTSYFGNNVSAKDVRLLLQVIYKNNVETDIDDDLSKVGVIAPFAGDSVDKYSIDSISSAVQSGYTYKVICNNDYSSDDMDGSDAKKALAGYYTNGFIKTIKITQNPKQDMYSNNIISNNGYFIN